MRHKNLETIAMLYFFSPFEIHHLQAQWFDLDIFLVHFSVVQLLQVLCKLAMGNVGVMSGILCLYVFTLWFTHLYRYTFKKPIIGTRTLTRHVPGVSFTTQKTHTCISQGRKTDTPENERSQTTLFAFITRCREMYNISNIYKYKISVL